MNYLRYVLLCCCLLATSLWSHAQDLDAFSYETYYHHGDTLRYRLLMPANYDIHKKYPLVVFLHGAGERGYDNNAQLLHGGTMFLRDSLRNKYPAFVLVPQCPTGSWWAPMDYKRDATGKITAATFPLDAPAPPATAALNTLLDSLLGTGKIDKKRVYIGGLSMGGMGTFYLITKRPELFAAAFPICGAGNVDEAGRFAGKVPVWIFHGGADGVVPVEASRAYDEKLKSLKAEYKYTEYPGVGHNSWDNVFVEPDLFRWLFSHKKK
ncbi:prolyl oligopeptidase family serine peptidase [Chitinophaga qingshengii]|uniref:Prolyl oligopeptidase family serine peptidase n=1 Tax=Chitinophaga qingshengii TaxID=1569794 RepID=A0ABR7TPN5_9BACT|nr:prolyl oligopeptidase family serine peptidase [Chitinophaga qingshengii]MBC9932432.1 prolyl oligopeptidase family serine peptidase [Chitinophaga qingshengii]